MAQINPSAQPNIFNVPPDVAQPVRNQAEAVEIIDRARYDFLRNIEYITKFNDERFCLLKPVESTSCQNIADANYAIVGKDEPQLSVVLDFNIKLTAQEEESAVMILDEGGSVLAKYHPTHRILHIDHHYQKLINDRSLEYNKAIDSQRHQKPEASTTPLLLELLTRLEEPTKLQIQSNSGHQVDKDELFSFVNSAFKDKAFTTFVNHTDNDSVCASFLLSAYLSGQLTEYPEIPTLLARNALNVDHWSDDNSPELITLTSTVKAWEKKRDLLNLLYAVGNVVAPQLYEKKPEDLRADFQVQKEGYEKIRQESLSFAQTAIKQSKLGIHYIEIPPSADMDASLVYGEFARLMKIAGADRTPVLILARKAKQAPKDILGNRVDGELYSLWIRSRDIDLSEYETTLALLFGIKGRSGAAANTRQKMRIIAGDNILDTKNDEKNSNAGYYVAPNQFDNLMNELSGVLTGAYERMEGVHIVDRYVKKNFPGLSNISIRSLPALNTNPFKESSVTEVVVTYDLEEGSYARHFILRRLDHSKLTLSKISEIIRQNRAGTYVANVHTPVALEWLASKEHSFALYDKLEPLPQYSDGLWQSIYQTWKSWQSLTASEEKVLSEDMPTYQADDYERQLEALKTLLREAGQLNPDVQLSLQSFKPSFVHSHFTLQNMLYMPGSPNIYITDFENSKMGHPVEDIGNFIAHLAMNNLDAALSLLSRPEVGGLTDLQFFLYKRSLEQIEYNLRKINLSQPDANTSQFKIIFFQQFASYIASPNPAAEKELKQNFAILSNAIKERLGEEGYAMLRARYGVGRSEEM